MTGSQGSQEQAMTEWLLAMFDAGTDLRVIQRMSAFTGLQTNKRLQTALDAASGPAPTDIIIRNPDGEPDQGILAGHQRGTHAPAVRWRLPGRLPRRPKLKPRWDVHLSGDEDQLG